jgi:hypothetical protein
VEAKGDDVASLSDILLADDMKRKVVDDACRLIEDEVRAKRGMSGLAIKAGYKTFKRFKPGALQMAVHGLLDEFAVAADPFYQDHVASGKTGSVAQTMVPRKREMADALLVITDRRGQRFDNRVIKKAYFKLRPTAQRATEDAIPGVCRLIDRYV